MIGTVARVASAGRLRREYLGKDEAGRYTLSGARACWHQAPDKGFTFHGHRLSSLFRNPVQSRFWLIRDERRPASSFQKYSFSDRKTGARP